MAEPKIKKTVSEYIQREQPQKVDESHQVVQPTTKTILVDEPKVKTKLPEVLKQTLKLSKQNQNQLADGKDLKQSKFTNFVHQKVKSLKNMVFCQICQTDFKKTAKPVYLCECEHKFNFCESCLHHYTIYKIKRFEQVMCPREGCNALINTQSNFFKNLPIDIQRNYKKINRFYTAAKDPNIKMCPKQDCEGFLNLQGNQTMICNLCKGQFCSKCLLKKHEGTGNLHYRQCKKCKMVIEKDQGCNHMTCRCKYQFCYVCGLDWNPAHYGPHDDKGNLIIVATNTNNNTGENQDCCDNFCETCCGRLLFGMCMGIVKFFAILFGLMMVLSVLLLRDIPTYFGIIVLTLVGGLFIYSIEHISEQQCPLMSVFIIFFPISMAIGLKKACSQIFCQAIPELFKDSCTMFGNIFDNLLNMQQNN